MTASTLDIVLPCYNPQQGWEEKVITSYKDICKALAHIKIQFIVVNDGSTKNVTQEAIEEMKGFIPLFQYIQCDKNAGKGAAVRTGVSRSTAEICIYTDIDFPYTINSLLSIFQKIYLAECDIAAGIKAKSYYAHVPAGRKFISKFLRSLTKFFLRLEITDTQCGLKGFNEKGKKLFLSTTINRYLFDLEFIYFASRKRELSILYVPVQLREGVVATAMSYKLLLAESRNFLNIVMRSIFTR